MNKDPPMRATLFGLASSHPTLTAELMLRHKGIDYRRIDLMPGLHQGVLRAMGFPGVTVPAMRIDGTRLQGTRTIAPALDALLPSSPLFPLDPIGGAPSRRPRRGGTRCSSRCRAASSGTR